MTTTDHRRAAALLAADLDYLTKREEFIRFMDRLKARRDDTATTVLRGEMDPAAREIERQKFLLLDEIVAMPDQDRSAAFRVLEQDKRAQNQTSV
jgi:hypothetical protein